MLGAGEDAEENEPPRCKQLFTPKELFLLRQD